MLRRTIRHPNELKSIKLGPFDRTGMSSSTIHLLLATIADRVSRQQAQAIGYVREKSRVIKEQIRGKTTQTHRRSTSSPFDNGKDTGTKALARSPTAKTLKEHGIRPAPERPATWRTFLKMLSFMHRDRLRTIMHESKKTTSSSLPVLKLSG